MNTTPALIIDIVGVVFSLISILFILRAVKNFGGEVGSALRIMVFMVASVVLALLYTIVFVRLKLFPIPGGIDIHHILMFSGIIFFLIAANKLRKISR